MLRASALTFYSLLSIVPIIALAFGISKGFGLEARLREQIEKNLSSQETVANNVVDYAQNMLDNTSGGIVAGVGFIILFFTVIRVIGNIEEALNDIWNVKASRSIARKFADYTVLILMGPAAVILSGAINVVISKNLISIIGNNDFSNYTLRLIPVLLLTLLLTFIYSYMPNRKINLLAAMFGGFITSILFQVFQYGYIIFQDKMNSYEGVYGSLAALPLFMIWLQASWTLVLFGAEVSFSVQTANSFEYEHDIRNISRKHKQLVALSVVTECVRRFMKDEEGPSANELSERLETPLRLVYEVLDELVEARVISKLHAEDPVSPSSYQPAMDLEILTIQKVIDKLEAHGSADIPIAKHDEIDNLESSLDGLHKTFSTSDFNKRIKDLVIETQKENS